MSFSDEVSRICDTAADAETLQKYSRDASVFSITPSLVAFPKNADEVSSIVRAAKRAKAEGEDISITARSAGTDMSGGSLTHSVMLDVTRYMNRIEEVSGEKGARTGYVTAEPGAYYRDVEKETNKKGLVFPSFPASKDLCAIGGIVSNNSGGELTLSYGKTDRYVRELDVVLSDGSKAIVRPLSMEELAEKEAQQDTEGTMYREIHALIEKNAEEIERARPTVSKNSSGYNLWDVLDKKNGVFDLTKLLTGSQGTLALITRATLGLVKLPPKRSLLVMFVSDLHFLPELVHTVLAQKPESFESYDDKTFHLAVRFLPALIGNLGLIKSIRLGFSFLPELFMVATGGVPKLVLLAEFADESEARAQQTASAVLREVTQRFPVKARVATSEADAEKYWTIRRQSFALLRKYRKLRATPFIDDFVVPPDSYPTFLPELNDILDDYDTVYTIAGHIGNGNFHIIPLMDLKRPRDRQAIVELSTKVYRLVTKYKGSITGEHNDGIIRTPYLPLMFSPRMIELFAEVKRIFDPQHIFNPGKKVDGSIEHIRQYMIKE